jgi:hypothetical protein
LRTSYYQAVDEDYGEWSIRWQLELYIAIRLLEETTVRELVDDHRRFDWLMRTWEQVDTRNLKRSLEHLQKVWFVITQEDVLD